MLTICSFAQTEKQNLTTTSLFNQKIDTLKPPVVSKKILVKKDTATKYIASQKGYWYFYQIKNDLETVKPVKGDIVNFNYDVKNIKGKSIYTELELKPQQYVVDKQNIMIGLRDGIKLMKKGEKVTFLFPSHMAFGYHGDNNKIGTNEPIICTVTLTNIKSEKPKTTLN